MRIYLPVIVFLVCFLYVIIPFQVFAEQQAYYKLSSGAFVDYERNTDKLRTDRNELCERRGMRLPTFDELKEMRQHQAEICNFYGKNPKSCFSIEYKDKLKWPYIFDEKEELRFNPGLHPVIFFGNNHVFEQDMSSETEFEPFAGPRIFNKLLPPHRINVRCVFDELSSLKSIEKGE